MLPPDPVGKELFLIPIVENMVAAIRCGGRGMGSKPVPTAARSLVVDIVANGREEGGVTTLVKGLLVGACRRPEPEERGETGRGGG